MCLTRPSISQYCKWMRCCWHRFSTSAAFMWEQRELECLDETETGSLKVNTEALERLGSSSLAISSLIELLLAFLPCIPSHHHLNDVWNTDPRGSRRQTRLDTSRTESGEHLVSWRLVWPTIIICITLQTVVIVQCSGILIYYNIT